MFIGMAFSSPIYKRLRALGFNNVYQTSFGLVYTSGIGQYQIEGPRVGCQHAGQSAHPAGNFIFIGKHRFAVQQNTQGLAVGTSPGKKQERDLPVVILSALSLFGFHGALAASRTMAAVAGMLFVAIQNRNVQAQIQGQRLVPLQAAVDLVEAIPQLADVHGGMHSSHGVGADHVPSQPPFPEPGGGNGFQRMETSQSRPATSPERISESAW